MAIFIATNITGHTRIGGTIIHNMLPLNGWHEGHPVLEKYSQGAMVNLEFHQGQFGRKRVFKTCILGSKVATKL